MKISTPIALKLHAFGLTQLHDPNWTGMDLFDRLKQHTRGRVEPTALLFKTLRKGLLYYIGLWLYHDYIISDIHRMSLRGEYRLWYLEDLLALLDSASVPQDDLLVTKARKRVEKIDAMYSCDEHAYFKAVDRDSTYTVTDKLIEATPHVDHIIALAKGGTNDLCNLQLLCDDCSLKKGAKRFAVKSSVPEYLQFASERRHRRSGM